MLPHGSAMKAPESAYAPVEAAPVRAIARPSCPAPAVESREASPAPLLPASERDDSVAASAPAAAASAPVKASAAPAAASAAPSAASAPALAKTASVDMTGSARSSARLQAKAARPAKPAAKSVAAAPALKPFATPKLDLTRDSFATKVHYSVASRAELMGRAAGPVYNFGGSADLRSKLGRMAGQTSHQVDELAAKVDQTDVAPAAKESMKKDLESLRAKVNEADAAAK
jgi:hypothetical protein